ncbi:MAG: WecB/TagA/CpsF family glycosyltransferase [bacterium]|nr:WecB/TagA/CpsF family glycosyltransferase [bacterium]
MIIRDRAISLRCAGVLGIPVDRCSPEEFKLFLGRAVAGSRTQRVVTLNPEIALAARRHSRFGNLVRTADLIPADGIGIALALWWSGQGRIHRLTGNDILPILCAYAQREKLPVAFLLRTDGLTTPDVLRAELKRRWPDLKAAIGSVDIVSTPDDALCRAVNDHQPAFLVMNVGGIAQEEWICRNADRFPSTRVVVGLGGAIDYLCGTVQSPPAVVRRFGFEWLWRLIRQPWRARRIVDAVIVFPSVVILERLRKIHIPRLAIRFRLS